MSKIFYDNLIDHSEVEKKIKKISKDRDQREELYALVDEITHNRALGCIFSKLPEKHHKEFISEFKKRPHDEGLFNHLQELIKEDIKELLKIELHRLTDELLLIIHDKTSEQLKK